MASGSEPMTGKWKYVNAARASGGGKSPAKGRAPKRESLANIKVGEVKPFNTRNPGQLGIF
jgi:hypothetical protein